MIVALIGALALGPPQHGHRHGNPEDLGAYIAKMEEPGRAQWQMPERVVATLAVQPGQTICDIGAGPGYFSLRLARAAGHVFAVDVEPRILAVLADRIRASGARNVTPVLALEDAPLLPRASCDLVLIVDTFHHFPDGVAYLRGLAAVLKPGGRIVNIDFHRRELPVGPPIEHKIDRADFLKMAQAASLQLVAEHDFLPYQYFLVLKP